MEGKPTDNKAQGKKRRTLVLKANNEKPAVVKKRKLVLASTHTQRKNMLNRFTNQLIEMVQNKRDSVSIDLATYYGEDASDKEIKNLIPDLIKRITQILVGRKILLSSGDVTYAINEKNTQRLKNFFESKIVSSAETQSDGQIIQELIRPDNILKVSIINKPKLRYNFHKGGFFKYVHNTDLDLQKYQIFKNIDEIECEDNCLINALKQGGLSETKLQQIRLISKTRDIPISKLEEVCNLLDISISLKRTKIINGNDKNYNTNFGKAPSNSSECYHIGLLDDHYFIIDDTDITAYAVKNYTQIKHLENYRKIYTKENDNYKRKNGREIDSYTLISLLLQNKEQLLTPINKMEILDTPYYKKVESNEFDLNYTPIEKINYKKIELTESKKKDKVFKNVFFDFETYTDENGKHIPYLCCMISDEMGALSFYGLDCGKKLLDALKNFYFNSDVGVRLIAHNSSYDLRFLMKYLVDVNEISKGTKCMTCKGKYSNLDIEIKDSLQMISMPLKDFPKTFKIKDTIKEVICYDMYNKTDCLERIYIPIEEGLKWIREYGLDENQFLDNITRWNIGFGDVYNCVEYSKKYCEIDCIILKQGYETFRNWMIELTSIDINEILTIASLAHRHFIKNKCYEDVYQLSGVTQNFIQKCVVGGRVMTSQNKKIIVEPKENRYVMDFDAVSLYPSAMKRMKGFLKGLPKILKNLTFDFLQTVDGYFIEIKILDVGIHRNFPLMSYIDDDSGVRNFTNEMIGKNIYVDKTTLEDLIKFQNIKFEIIRGYYFDEGYNTTINTVIENVFNERKRLKKEGNPAEIVYKLIMNSGYGKTIMKPVEYEIKYFNSKEEVDNFTIRNYEWVDTITKIDDSECYRVKLVNVLNNHFNIAHVGVCILSESKRIMNEVMTTAEDNGIPIFYQDTDSMHLFENDIPVLAKKFNEIYGRDLIGKNMGQFHSDFDLKDCEDVKAISSVFLGKKCYIDKLVGINEHTKQENYGYHIRMKGVPTSTVKYAAQKNSMEIFDLYRKMGEECSPIKFDLTEEGKRCNFKMNKNYTVFTQSIFERELKFLGDIIYV